jgi:hypothetical protein
MPVRAVAFDIGGVLEVPTDTDLEDRWEPRLGLRPGEFFQRLRQSGLGRDANLGRSQRPSSSRRWVGCTGWISRPRRSCWSIYGTGMWVS